jgi:hypothetical protein
MFLIESKELIKFCDLITKNLVPNSLALEIN